MPNSLRSQFRVCCLVLLFCVVLRSFRLAFKFEQNNGGFAALQRFAVVSFCVVLRSFSQAFKFEQNNGGFAALQRFAVLSFCVVLRSFSQAFKFEQKQQRPCRIATFQKFGTFTGKRHGTWNPALFTQNC